MQYDAHARLSRVAVIGLLFLAPRIYAADQKVNYVVPEPTFVIQQPKPNGCWATVAAMMLSWKNRRAMTIEAVVQSAGAVYQALYKSDVGLSAAEKPSFLDSLHFKNEAPATYTAQALESKLKLWGPLWVTTAEPTGKKFSIHARVLLGIMGDGSGTGTTLLIADPADGTKHFENLDTFTQKLDKVAKSDYGAGADVRPLIVHF